MVEKVETMPYQEAWEKMQGDYLVAMGVLYRYLMDTYGEQGLIDYLNKVEIDRFRSLSSGTRVKAFSTSSAVALIHPPRRMGFRTPISCNLRFALR